MVDLQIEAFENYDDFVQEWHAEELDVSLDEARNRSLINEDKTRLLWQLLGQLENDELLIQIPKWFADQKVGFIDGRTPTEFVGRIDRETEKAILFTDSASARSLTKLAHRIHQLETSIEHANDDDRQEWMVNRLQQIRERFESREDAIALSEEWLPKSQIQHAVRRND
ncbi:hypothetical protein [Halalkalicoccus salilacus]|uniref:hypothetical protein n=1 Tax=Halalkalicoccus salilacus TaxID=3117459 RepID=UPI00300F1FF3